MLSCYLCCHVHIFYWLMVCPSAPHWFCGGSATAFGWWMGIICFGWWMGIICFIVHTWRGFSILTMQRALSILTMLLVLVCWCFLVLCIYYFIPYFCFIEINPYFCILCGLSPIDVAAHTPGGNNVITPNFSIASLSLSLSFVHLLSFSLSIHQSSNQLS